MMADPPASTRALQHFLLCSGEINGGRITANYVCPAAEAVGARLDSQ